ncbi:MAG: glycosyltransferase family 4 protein [Chloroflexi bacterium]|nr:glycosyltransferase family 4 protein [Chloroflexota bacterium]
MKVVLISKALVVGEYQRKLAAIAAQGNVELTCIVPPSWKQDGREQRLERRPASGYELLVAPILFNGHFHFFLFPTLPRLLRRLRPDVVHVDEEPYNLATLLATRQARAVGARALFFTWQNLYRLYPPPFHWVERDVFRTARYAIAGNQEAAEVLRAKGYLGPLAVIPQFGVDPTAFAPAPVRDGPTSRPFTIGYVGRLVEEKGMFDLLDAAGGLEGAWQLRLVGHGPLAGPLAERAVALGFGERLVVRPAVPSGEVPALLRELDVLVLPSRTRPNWKEQFGRVLVEAMASGIPVVGSSSGEIPNVVGPAGLVFPEGDTAVLRATLAELQSSSALRAELSALGRQRVLERFTHDQIARQTVAVYREMLNR